MLLEPGVERGRYHDRKPESGEFQSRITGSCTKKLSAMRCGLSAVFRSKLRSKSSQGSMKGGPPSSGSHTRARKGVQMVAVAACCFVA